MALVLARFLFGLSITLAAVLVLLLAAALGLRMVRGVFGRMQDERQQAIASGVLIFLIVAVALALIYFSGTWLHGALGDWLAPGTAHWLGDGEHLPAGAVLGAIAAIGLLAYAPAIARLRRRGDGDDKPKTAARKTAQQGELKLESGKARATVKATPRKKAAAPAPKGPRVAVLGRIAAFVLALGAVLLTFSYIVAPNGLPLPPDWTALQASPLAQRARPVYLTAYVLLTTGVALLGAWFIIRRPAPR